MNRLSSETAEAAGDSAAVCPCTSLISPVRGRGAGVRLP